MNDKVKIVRDTGEVVDGVAPVIISASRSTDIPAFFARWFMNRLAKGYCVWYNPFNQQPMYISFEKTKVVVFWTKNPKPIIKYLPELDRKGIHYYFQYTLNDYEAIYDAILVLADEADGFSRRTADPVLIQKCKWILDMLATLEDVPHRKAKYILSATK